MGYFEVLNFLENLFCFNAKHDALDDYFPYDYILAWKGTLCYRFIILVPSVPFVQKHAINQGHYDLNKIKLSLQLTRQILTL